MATASPGSLKRAADLLDWLDREVGPNLSKETEAIPHGGTALTLLGLKGSTKDVDLAFRTRDDFDRFVAALKALGYRTTRDFRPVSGEVYLRLEHPDRRVDVVDLRHPTWNNWRLTDLVLAKSLVVPAGPARVVRLDRDALFLFKTYPLRDTDLDDLGTIIRVSRPDGDRVVALFDEQDGLHRSELFDERVAHEPLFRVLELRCRYAASLSLLREGHRRAVPKVARHARAVYDDMRLDIPLTRVIRRLRDPERPVDWDRLLGRRFEALRNRVRRVP